MGLLKRIENGETTVQHAYRIKNIGIAIFLVGIGVGAVVITIVFYILGG